MKAKKTIILLLIVWAIAPGSAFAISTNTSTRSGSETIQNSAANRGLRNCNRVQLRLQNKKNGLTENRTAHSQVYDNMLGRLTRFSTNIKAKGYDASKLDGDIIVLTKKIDEFKTMVATSNQSFETMFTDLCTADTAVVKGRLLSARSDIRNTHQKAAEIRDFYKNIIKPDLLALKEQHPGAVSNTTTNEAAADNSTMEQED